MSNGEKQLDNSEQHPELWESLKEFLESGAFKSADAEAPISVYCMDYLDFKSEEEPFGACFTHGDVIASLQAEQIYLEHGSGFDRQVLVFKYRWNYMNPSWSISEYRQSSPDQWRQIGVFLGVPHDTLRKSPAFFLHPVETLAGVKNLVVNNASDERLHLENTSANTSSSTQSFLLSFDVLDREADLVVRFKPTDIRYIMSIPLQVLFTDWELVRAALYHAGSVLPIWHDGSYEQRYQRMRTWRDDLFVPGG